MERFGPLPGDQASSSSQPGGMRSVRYTSVKTGPCVRLRELRIRLEGYDDASLTTC